MSEISENNKRIAKNTLYLYLRMFLLLLVGLFTSRVTLQALGINDIGIINVVGGIIGMLDYVNVQLSMGSSRFLTAALGRGDKTELRKTFSACITLHTVIALLTLIAGETIGLWFVNNKLVFDAERTFAVNWVYQLSLFSMFIGIMQTPYSASVVSHEKMSIFAYMTIYDVVMKLVCVCLLLYIEDTDKLILYSTFYFLVGLSSMIIYRIYCTKSYEECKFKFGYEKKLYKDIWNYIGWNTIGSFIFLANNQGVTVLLNLFFGPVVNGARSLAFTASAYIEKFVQNFQMAIRPQVIKYYAQGKNKEMNHLVCNNSKYSSFLVIILGLPILLETRYVIYLWLGQIPEYVVPFIRLTIILMFIRCIDSPVGNGIHAVGKMKLPNITSSIIYMTILPIIYVFLRFGASPIIAYLISIFIYPLALFTDLWILNKYTGFNVFFFFKDVCLRVLMIIITSTSLPLIVHCNMGYGIIRFVIVCTLTIALSTITIYRFGLSYSVRRMIIKKARTKISNIFTTK